MYEPGGLPLPDARVAGLRALAFWSEDMVWVSLELHGAMKGIMKSQIDWVPLSIAGVRPSQGTTLAFMQMSGGSQSFTALDHMRVLGRWMRSITIPNQSSVPRAFMEFGDDDRIRPSPFYNRIVDVAEPLVKFTYLTRDGSDHLVNRHSERVESAEDVATRVNQRSI